MPARTLRRPRRSQRRGSRTRGTWSPRAVGTGRRTTPRTRSCPPDGPSRESRVPQPAVSWVDEPKLPLFLRAREHEVRNPRGADDFAAVGVEGTVEIVEEPFAIAERRYWLIVET